MANIPIVFNCFELVEGAGAGEARAGGLKGSQPTAGARKRGTECPISIFFYKVGKFCPF